MNSADFEKLAGRLAEIATSADFEKTAFPNVSEFLGSDAGRYLMGGVGGAVAGGVLGATQPDKEKRKRNMLYYGTLGGLGGLGVAHLANSFNGPPAGPITDKQRKIESDAAASAAFTTSLTDNAPGALMRHGTGLTTGLAANRYIGAPIAKGTAAAAAKHTQALTDQQARAVSGTRASNLAASKDMTAAFKQQQLELGQRQAQRRARMASNADVFKAFKQPVPLKYDIDQLKARQAAATALKTKTYNTRASSMASGQAAAELADAAKFTKGMKGRGRALSALNLLLQVAPAAAAYYGGTKLPAAISPFAPETSK